VFGLEENEKKFHVQQIASGIHSKQLCKGEKKICNDLLKVAFALKIALYEAGGVVVLL